MKSGTVYERPWAYMKIISNLRTNIILFHTIFSLSKFTKDSFIYWNMLDKGGLKITSIMFSTTRINILKRITLIKL